VLDWMPSLLVHLDEATYEALNQVVAKSHRAEFVRVAIREAIRRREYADMRLAYSKQPDLASEADSWSGCEKFEEK